MFTTSAAYDCGDIKFYFASPDSPPNVFQPTFKIVVCVCMLKMGGSCQFAPVSGYFKDLPHILKEGVRGRERNYEFFTMNFLFYGNAGFH